MFLVALGAVALHGCGDGIEEEGIRRPGPAPARVAFTTRGELREDMRAAWADRAMWNRAAMISALHDSGDVSEINAQVLRSQARIGDQLEPFLEADGLAEMNDILRADLNLRNDLFTAVKVGDLARRRAAVENLRAIPSAQFSQMQEMLRGGLDESVSQLDARATGDFGADLSANDRVLAANERFSDVLSQGFSEQFPDRVQDIDFEPREGELRGEVNRIFRENMMMRRSLMVSSLDGLPDRAAIADRLTQNQRDLAGVLAPSMGAESLAGLRPLLEARVGQESALFDAARAGDLTAIEAAQTSWRNNADDIVGSLSSTNPGWNRQRLEMGFTNDMDQRLEMMNARIGGDFEAELETFDTNMRDHAAFGGFFGDSLVSFGSTSGS
jgi:hypothetical protein